MGEPDMNLNLSILNADTTVVPGSIVLRFDGINVTGSASISAPAIEGPGATVRYRPGLLLPRRLHTISVVFSDNASHTISNQWSFTVQDLPVLATADATGGGPSSQFTVQVNKSQQDNPTASPVDSWPNDSFRAERQIAGQLINADTFAPFDNEAAGANNGSYTAQLINFNQDGNSAGYFPGDTTYPGVDPNNYAGDPNNLVIAATIDLQLTNGVYAMGVRSDDGYKVTAGGSGGTNVYLGSSETYPGSRDRGEYFSFVVQNTGVYRFRLLQWEGKGGANVEWWWVDDRKTGTGRRLINAPVTAPPGIPAGYVFTGSPGPAGFGIQMAKAPRALSWTPVLPAPKAS
jgi:hypothetical protein